MAFQPGRRAHAMHRHARRKRGARQPARIAQRVDMAAGRIAPAAFIMRTADQLPDGVTVIESHRRAQRLPLAEALFADLHPARRVRRLHPAILHRLAIDTMAADHVEGERRRIADHRGIERPAIRPVFAQHVGRIGPGHRRDDLPVITAGRAPTRFRRLQHHDGKRRVTLLQMQRGGQAGIAAADNADIGTDIALHGRRFRRGGGGLRPQRGRQIGPPVNPQFQRHRQSPQAGISNCSVTPQARSGGR